MKGDYSYKVPPDIAADYVPISPEERKKRVAELNERVKENIVRIQNSAEFRNFLIAMSHFHNYSWANQMLIWVQRPNATHVAGYNTWRDLGRQVKYGETGIQILAPLGPTAITTFYRATDDLLYVIKRSGKGWAIYNENDEIVQDGFKSWAEAARKLKAMGFVEKRQTLSVHNFKVVSVFDISQTVGKPLPEFDVPVLTGAANAELFDELLRLGTEQGIKVVFEIRAHESPSTKGSYHPGPPPVIWVKNDESQAQQLNVLLHETAHHYTATVFEIPRQDAETIAECAACIVGAHYGFDTGTRSFPYVAGWARDEKTLNGNLTSIQEVAEKIIDAIETRRARMFPSTRKWK